MEKLTLSDNERIVAVVPELCSGPGWANKLTTVYIKKDPRMCEGRDEFRTVYIQFDELSSDMRAIWHIGEMVSRQMVDIVRAIK
jgi:hypothetical protein